MIRHEYETIYLTRPDLDEAAQARIDDKLKGIVENKGGELLVFDKLARSLVDTIVLPVPTSKGKGVLVTLVYTAVASYIILKIVDLIVGLRVSEEEESEGLDTALHGERGYII